MNGGNRYVAIDETRFHVPCAALARMRGRQRPRLHMYGVVLHELLRPSPSMQVNLFHCAGDGHVHQKCQTPVNGRWSEALCGPAAVDAPRLARVVCLAQKAAMTAQCH
ncbi:hypothetical protein TRVL_04906 [Trypanosoma vivax]|nr:hypothetical protein TRVL_04906 [Trypanosoma vivax]